MQNEQNRTQIIVRTSLLGIVANLLLVAFKAAVGLISGSIAVVLDAVNNLTDALSSVITIVGAKLAGKKPDKEHPLGHGRVEYLSSMVVAALVLYAGITALVESVKKILAPETPDYSLVSLIIIAAAVVVKLALGTYVKGVGKRVNSGSLVSSGQDALSDAVLSGSVLASALLFTFTDVSLEAWVGALISGFIIKAGYEMMKEAYDQILGERMDGDLVKEIKATICEDEAVFGAYDLVLHAYGPDRLVGSVHVEIPDTMTADEIDLMERRIAHNVFVKHGVGLSAVGIYSMNTQNNFAREMRDRMNALILAHQGVLQTHGFYLNEKERTVSLDVILDFAVPDRKALYETICQELRAAYPDYTIHVTLDLDF